MNSSSLIFRKGLDLKHAVAGVLAANVVMAVSKTVFEANVSLVATNAGPSARRAAAPRPAPAAPRPTDRARTG